MFLELELNDKRNTTALWHFGSLTLIHDENLHERFFITSLMQNIAAFLESFEHSLNGSAIGVGFVNLGIIYPKWFRNVWASIYDVGF